MHSKFDIVLDKVDDICEKFEMEGLHHHPTYKQFKRLFAELKAAAHPEDIRAVVDWSYCPECGSEEIHHQEGKHKQCADCHQEYWSDIDYEDVVVKNLHRLYRHPQHPVVMPERLTMKSFQTVDRGSANYKAGFNACLGAVEELNK